MNNQMNSDEQFDNNLLRLGSQTETPAGLSLRARSRCEDSLGHAGQADTHVAHRLRRPALLSTLAIAAVLAMAVGIFSPFTNGTTVRAATILERLTEQIEEVTLIEVTLDSIVLDNVSLNGKLQVSDGAVAGDISVKVDEGDGQVEIDLSLGMSNDEGWILIRKLQVPDAQANMMIGLLFPPGTDTLLKIPSEMLDQHIGMDIGQELKSLASSDVITFIREMIENPDEIGAIVEEQSDGTILLSLPIESEEVFENIGRWAAESGLIDVDEDELEEALEEVGKEIQSGNDAAGGLIGSTFSVVYDPITESVRSFAIEDIGASNGLISVRLTSGEVDPALLDASRVSTPSTRVLDLSAIEDIVKSFGGTISE